MTKSRDIDILNGKTSSNLIRFAIPIALSAMLQQLFNSADTAVVGRFADANALGAVGTNSEIAGLLVSLSSGLSVGVNVIVSRYIGSKQTKYIKDSIHTAILISLIFGIFVGILGQFIARPIMIAIHTDAKILEQAATYLRLYFASYPFLLLYDFVSAILRAKGDSKRPFFALLASGILNVILNLVFVICFKMDVAGVGLSTVISTAFSSIIVLILLAKEKNEFQFSPKNLKLSGKITSNILKVGIPAAVQGAAFCFANIFIQSAVNIFGAMATAGNSVAVTFEYFAYYTVTAFGQAVTTFISQNYACGNTERCKKIFRQCLVFSLVSTAMLTTPLTVFKEFFVSIFTTDQTALHYASIRILMILMFQPICALYEIPAGAMRAYGHSLLPSVIALSGICVTRISWIIFVFPHLQTYPGLLFIHPFSWVITSTAMWIAFAIIKKKQKI